ncbi:hypothetical protein [Flavobacterium sp.]|uniref:hypothetical protein n=1 Tax=Flavobacterium sp. TaxID=239 RepID=UPI003528BB1A
MISRIGLKQSRTPITIPSSAAFLSLLFLVFNALYKRYALITNIRIPKSTSMEKILLIF